MNAFEDQAFRAAVEATWAETADHRRTPHRDLSHVRDRPGAEERLRRDVRHRRGRWWVPGFASDRDRAAVARRRRASPRAALCRGEHRTVPGLGDSAGRTRPATSSTGTSRRSRSSPPRWVSRRPKSRPRRRSWERSSDVGPPGRQGLPRHGHRRKHGSSQSRQVRSRRCVARRLRRDARAGGRRRSRPCGAWAGRWCHCNRVSLSEPADCAKSSSSSRWSEFGTIDVLFNLAARSHFHRLEDFTDEEWRAAQQDEVDLVFYLTRAAWPHLRASRGVVVNMASLNGSLSFKLLPSLAHTTNKAAIIGMTRQLALEGSERGIRVNSISPGLIESNATRGVAGGRGVRLARCSAERCSVGSGRPEEVANVALFLVIGRELVHDRGGPGRRRRDEGVVT